LDFSRLYPPECPALDWRVVLQEGNPALYQLLRPELVRTHPIPLCSEAFTNFAPAADKLCHVRDVYEACQRLYRFVIPSFALWLVAQDPASYPQEFSLSNKMHSRGINVRHLFRVLVAVAALNDSRLSFESDSLSLDRLGSTMDSQPASSAQNVSAVRVRAWIHLIVVEMSARVIKARVRGMMQSSQQADIRELVARELNSFLSGRFASENASMTTTTGQGWWRKQEASKERTIGIEMWSQLRPAFQRKFQFTFVGEAAARASLSEPLNPDRSVQPLAPSEIADSPAFSHLPATMFVGCESAADDKVWRLRKWASNVFKADVLYANLDRRTLFLRLQQVLEVTLRTEAWRERCAQ
jgi:hypothetical protein